MGSKYDFGSPEDRLRKQRELEDQLRQQRIQAVRDEQKRLTDNKIYFEQLIKPKVEDVLKDYFLANNLSSSPISRLQRLKLNPSYLNILGDFDRAKEKYNSLQPPTIQIHDFTEPEGIFFYEHGEKKVGSISFTWKLPIGISYIPAYDKEKTMLSSRVVAYVSSAKFTIDIFICDSTSANPHAYEQYAAEQLAKVLNEQTRLQVIISEVKVNSDNTSEVRNSRSRFFSAL